MKKTFLTFALLSVTLSLVAACGTRSQKATPEAEAVVQQAPDSEQATDSSLAPDFELPDLQGNPLKLTSLRGKYVILDFWGSWCPWCIKGFPSMKASYAKYKDRLEILGIDCRDSETKWKAAVEEYELPWLQVRCPDSELQQLAQQYHVEGFPTKVVVSPEGKLAKVVVGEDPAFYSYLDTLFAK